MCQEVTSPYAGKLNTLLNLTITLDWKSYSIKEALSLDPSSPYKWDSTVLLSVLVVVSKLLMLMSCFLVENYFITYS